MHDKNTAIAEIAAFRGHCSCACGMVEDFRGFKKASYIGKWKREKPLNVV